MFHNFYLLSFIISFFFYWQANRHMQEILHLVVYFSNIRQRQPSQESELSSGLPYGQQEPKYLSHPLLPPRAALPRNRVHRRWKSQELRHRTGHLNCCAKWQPPFPHPTDLKVSVNTPSLQSLVWTSTFVSLTSSHFKVFSVRWSDDIIYCMGLRIRTRCPQQS